MSEGHLTPATTRHEGIPIKGFITGARRGLGFNPFITPYKHDHQIMMYARLIQGYIVTTDKVLDFIKLLFSISVTS
ncbi:hypothetical protein D1867_12125 [Acidianus infernus]|uniref:Uncharacterized protein n=1 Tax=Acidianus infernus TaxID=12915 RepID=A0A6A9QPY9_ACIIN|nr:hypothetical protein [Acidianus infernus]MUM65958.1 hypothetical protein [Acidianus infernus]